MKYARVYIHINVASTRSCDFGGRVYDRSQN